MSEPALTAVEWATWQTSGYVQRDGQMILHSKGFGVQGTQRISVLIAPMDTETHACAAVCLNGQPFGFTHEDMELLGLLVFSLRPPAIIKDDGSREIWMREQNDKLQSLGDRIAALLPPETP